MDYCYVESFVGPVLLAASERGLARVGLPRADAAELPEPGWVEDGPRVAEARRQLQAYFAGSPADFCLELAPAGTEFQRRVWQAVRDIPFGRTASYAELARRIGRPTARRAVGAANGQNPLPIVVPCHRVIGGDGALRGHAFGLDRKRALLAHEARAARTALGSS
jgi:methylated-DNA-[protein]-cysteine S-methyltransferase